MKDDLRNVDLQLSINAIESSGRFCYLKVCYLWMRLGRKKRKKKLFNATDLGCMEILMFAIPKCLTHI